VKAHHSLFGALLALTPLYPAMAAEEITGPEADSTEPVRVMPSDGSTPVITSEFFNKLTVQTGYGPEDSQVDRDREMFYSLRYEPSFAWYSPEKRWAKWMVYGRMWLNYDSSQSGNLQNESTNNNNVREQPQGWYAELRELYVKRNLIGDDPRYSMSFGRQRFFDDYGLWWDDSLESVRFNYKDTFSDAFLAVGQKFHNYNTDVNSLPASEERTLYVMGEYAYRWSENNRAGVRMMYENDRSDHDVDDRYDFKGMRYGLFFKGDNLPSPVISDYHVELAALDGKMDNTNGTGVTTTGHSSKGWVALGEVGKRFETLPWTPRVALRGGLTDKPSDDNDGFRLNTIQSDRITRQGSYSTRLTSSFVSIDLQNLSYYGIALETQPTPRSALDLRLTQLNMRDDDGVVPIRMASDSRSKRQRQLDNGQYGKGDNVGQMLDLNYYWKMFPVALDGKHLDVNALVSASYLNAGSALKTGDDYQLSLGVVVSY